MPIVARFLYIVWYSVDPSVEVEWDRWMNSTHVPEVVERGNFLGAKRYAVKEGSSSSHATFYLAKDLQSLRAFFDGPAKELQQDYDERFGQTTQITRTLLEETHSI